MNNIQIKITGPGIVVNRVVEIVQQALIGNGGDVKLTDFPGQYFLCEDEKDSRLEKELGSLDISDLKIKIDVEAQPWGS